MQGIRQSEIINLKINHIDSKNMSIETTFIYTQYENLQISFILYFNQFFLSKFLLSNFKNNWKVDSIF